MKKEKVDFKLRIMHWFTYHPWLKLLALFLAVIAWFYVSDEISRFNH